MMVSKIFQFGISRCIGLGILLCIGFGQLDFAMAQVAFLECPEGSERKTAWEKSEIHEWCEDDKGRRQGGYSLRSVEGVPKVFVEYKDDIRNGHYVRYHSNGRPAEQGVILNDKPEGEWKRYHSSGQLSDIGLWKSGMPEGEWRLYHPNGKLEASGHFEKGERVGTWKFFDLNGDLASEKDYESPNFFLEAGYLGVSDGEGESHGPILGVMWSPVDSGFFRGFGLSAHYSTVQLDNGGTQGSYNSGPDEIDVWILSLWHYWQLGPVEFGLQLGELDHEDGGQGGGTNTEGIVGFDFRIPVGRFGVKRLSFNTSFVGSDLLTFSARAVFFEF